MILAFIQAIQDETQRKIVEDIYDLYYKHMYAIANNILKNHHDALDAVQDAFYNISDTVDMFENPRTQAVAALVSIYTRNAALNIYNKNKRYSKRFVSIEDMNDSYLPTSDESDDILQLLVDHEAANIVNQAISELDDIYKDVIQLKYFHHMRNIDIAKVLHIDVNMVNGRIFRAKNQLRKILGKLGYERKT